MKKLLFGFTAAIGIHSVSFAVCKGNDMTRLARQLDLNGQVNISKKNETETMIMSKVNRGTSVYKDFKSIVKESNAKLISAIFGAESEGVFAVVQDQNSCSVYVLGTDDGSPNKSEIVKIEKLSIEFLNPNKSLVKIQKTGCPETDLTKAAQKLNLQGDFKITTRNETDEVKMEVLTSSIHTDEVASINELAQKSNKNLLSKIFGSEDGVIVVTQDQKTCRLSLLGTDGEDIGYSSIQKIEEEAIEYTLEGGTKVSIHK